MTQEEQFDKLWWAYPNDLCRNKKGGRQPALKAFIKINPDENEYKRILLNLQAMKTADRKDKDAYRWPFVSSWLNQARYDDAIEIKEEKRVETHCEIEGCNNVTVGANFSICHLHVPSRMDSRLRAAWMRTGLDRNSPTLIEDCREYIKGKGWQI